MVNSLKIIYNKDKGDAMRGKFIVFEGPDGSGKTTILENVKEYLNKNNIDYILTREPGGTNISEEIRRLVLGNEYSEMNYRTEALLYAASRAQLVNEKIIPSLEEGRLVISDRYVISSLAYQGYGRDLGLEEVKQINDFATKGLEPDAIIFFQVDPVTVLKRKGQAVELDRLENESDSYHRRVYEGYQKVLEKYTDKISVIDASQTIEEVKESTINKLLDIIGG